ncbi:MAG TPA: hypothetical protein VIK89_06975 [Cytophagaceae bacterium]
MGQYSTLGEPVRFEAISGNLLFIDPLFFEHLTHEIEDEDLHWGQGYDEFLSRIEKKIFEGSKGYYLGYFSIPDFQQGIYELNLNEIMELTSESHTQAIDKSIPAFTLESGSFLIIDMANFEALLSSFNLDSLIQAVENETLDDYMERMSEKLENRGIAYVYYHPDDDTEEGSFMIAEGGITRVRAASKEKSR